MWICRLMEMIKKTNVYTNVLMIFFWIVKDLKHTHSWNCWYVGGRRFVCNFKIFFLDVYLVAIENVDTELQECDVII